MLSSVQTEYIGSRYNLQELYLYQDVSGAAFYVDAVFIGKRPTTRDEHGTQLDSEITKHYLISLLLIDKIVNLIPRR